MEGQKHDGHRKNRAPAGSETDVPSLSRPLSDTRYGLQ
jgi:hypothetical protein